MERSGERDGERSGKMGRDLEMREMGSDEESFGERWREIWRKMERWREIGRYLEKWRDEERD